MLDPQQRAAVDRFQQTGEMPVGESQVKAVEDFKRQEDVVGHTGRGSASLRIRDNYVHGTAFFRFPGEWRRVVFLLSGSATSSDQGEKLDVTIKQFDRTEVQNHTKHPSARFEVKLHQIKNGFVGDFFHPPSKSHPGAENIKLGEMSLMKSWSPVGWLLHVWLSM